MKNRPNHYRNIAGFLTLSGLLMGLAMAPEAGANDDKVFAPQICVPIDSTDRTIDATATEFWENRVEVTDARELICPLVRDDLDGELEHLFVTIENVVKPVAGDTTECCIHAFDTEGDMQSTVCDEADEGETTQTLDFEGPGDDLGDLDSEDNGYYVLTCDFPQAGEAIYRIRTSEDS